MIGAISELKNVMIRSILVGSRAESVIWIDNDDKVYVHGRNDKDQFGLDHMDNIYTPIIAENIPNKELRVVSAACGQHFTMVLCNDGSVWSSGYSHWHAHGHPNQGRLAEYAAIDLKVKIKKVSIGDDMSIFLDENGELWGCGYNTQQTLGLIDSGDDIDVKSPTKLDWFVDNKILIKDVEVGYFHVIAMDNKHCIYCWGYNGHGECAVDPDGKVRVPTPTQVLNNVEIKEIRIGAYHTGCITMDNQYYLWGGNSNNQVCIEDDEIYRVWKPNNVTQYVFEKTKCKEILDIVLGASTTLFVLKDP